MTKSTTFLIICMFCIAHLCVSNQPALAQSETVPIAEQARAVFKKRCLSCHSQSQSRGGLDMSTLDSILAGSTSGAVVEPGKPAESLLFTLAAHLESPKMPPNAPKIPERELKSISAWIESLAGSSGTRDTSTSMPKATANVVPKAGEPELGGLVKVKPLAGPLGITALASSESTLAVSGLHQVLLLDPKSKNWIGALDFPEGDVFALKFTSDGRRLIAAGGMGATSGSVVCWDIQSYKRQRSIAIEDDVVLAMDVSPDGQTVAVAGPKRIIELIDLATGTKKHVLRKHADWVSALAFSNDGVLLASGDRFGSIYLWDVRGGLQFDAAENHAAMVTALHFSRDSNQLWSAGKDGMIKQWDVPSNRIVSSKAVCETGVADLLPFQDRLLAVDHERRLLSMAENTPPVNLSLLASNPTRLAAAGSSSTEIAIGDNQSAIHFVSLLNGSLQTIPLPQQPQTTIVKRFPPKPAERVLTSAKDSASGTQSLAADAPAQVAETLMQLKKTLSQTKQLLEQTQSNVSELEKRIAELEAATNRNRP